MTDPSPNTAARPGPRPSPQTEFGARLLALRGEFFGGDAERAARGLGIASLSHYYKLERGVQAPSGSLRMLVETMEVYVRLWDLALCLAQALPTGRVRTEDLPRIAEAFDALGRGDSLGDLPAPNAATEAAAAARALLARSVPADPEASCS